MVALLFVKESVSTNTSTAGFALCPLGDAVAAFPLSSGGWASFPAKAVSTRSPGSLTASQSVSPSVPSVPLPVPGGTTGMKNFGAVGV